MDNATLVAGLDFARTRLLGSLSAIEKSGRDVAEILAWRPGPGRAHIGWQAMHLAATHDKYLNVFMRGGEVKDPDLVKNYGGGSVVSDENVPSLALIHAALERNFTEFRGFVIGLQPGDFDRTHTTPAGVTRTLAEGILLMIWHETHHQGQVHLTWNLYKAARGAT